MSFKKPNETPFNSVQLSENKYNSYGNRIDMISFDIFGPDLNACWVTISPIMFHSQIMSI